ncbi:hypothetical protein [Marinobacter shengliensis]|uniref:hypothetical protein n=1 Tax=Marinobacter shengliensis TaxID=1389223 RepID=UPI000D0FC74A|nr:hypothetical protein [Marinobacter shengliensis]PSF10873.1 hypothetical protein C7H10_13905 [Marinobacter shengliensis]
MFKKTLISLAVASSLGLTGCFDSAGDGGNANPDYKISNPDFTGKTWPVFNPLTGQIPVPSDLNFDQQAADGSFGVAGDMTNPVIAALNNLSGASTVAPAVVRLSGDIDASTVDSRAFIPNPAAGQEGQLPVIPNPNQNVFLIEVQYASGEPVRALGIGEPPTIPSAITFQVAAGQNPLGNGRDLSGRDQGAAIAHLVELANSPAYDHDVLELDGDSAIRIRPNKPLNPLSRHVVVITNGIKDISGEAIVASPAYQNLTDENQPVGNSALNPVRTLINSFWENIGTNYFALNNSSRAALGMPALTDSNIALSYSFTTSEDKKVLSHMANPANWISDQLRRSVTVGAASAAVKDGASDFATVFGAVSTALANFEPSIALEDDGLAPCDEPPFDTPLGSFDDQFNCVGALVKFSLDGVLADAQLSFPQPKAIENIGINSTNDALSVSAVLSSLNVQPGQVDVHQGFIELPQYVAVPDSTQTGSTSTLRTVSWRPDVPLAAVLGEALGATIPQQDADVSNVLNYNFPFPTLQGKVEVPMLVITPADADPTTAEGDPLIPVIFQHGITTDRSAALAFGTQLVAAAQSEGLNLAVFAIDQPLHGVSPFTRDDQESLALTLLVQGGLVPAPTEDENGDPIVTPQVQATIDAIIARQFPGLVLQSIAFDTSGETPVVQCEAALHEGIAPSAERTFQEAVANVLSIEGNETPQCGPEAAQSLGGAFSLDNTVANAGSTIPGLAAASTATGAVEGINERHYGFTAGPDGNPIAMNFESGVGSSGSLFINLTNFMNSRDVLRQGAIDLMNLTATINSLEGVTKNGVTFIGHSLGTLNGGAFVGAATASGNPDLFVAGAHLLTPVAGTTRLLENSPSFAPTILGGLRAAAGLEQGDANLETFFYVNQAMLDSVDPINFANELAVSNTVLAQIAGDRTTPNAADVRFGEDNAPLNITFPNGVRVQSPAAPLSGSEALAFVMGATPTDLPLNLPMITRYQGGVHGTPVLPQESIAEAGDVLKDRSIATGGEVVSSAEEAQATFGTMIAQTIALIGTVNAPPQD